MILKIQIWSANVQSDRIQFKLVTSFDDNIENIDHFKSFEYQAKLLGNKFAQFTPNKGNGILKNAAIAVPLKYLRNYWRSLGLKN